MDFYDAKEKNIEFGWCSIWKYTIQFNWFKTTKALKIEFEAKISTQGLKWTKKKEVMRYHRVRKVAALMRCVKWPPTSICELPMYHFIVSVASSLYDDACTCRRSSLTLTT
jgi:hypothetical protein